MAVASISASINLLTGDYRSSKPCIVNRLPASIISPNSSAFLRGSTLSIRTSSFQMQTTSKARSLSVRCEQGTKKGNGLDVWLGRVAMLGFAIGLSVEVATGKGILENVGLITPLPTAALGVTALVGILTAVFIFQSASEN